MSLNTPLIIRIDLSISLYVTIKGGANLTVLSAAGTFNNFLALSFSENSILLVLSLIPSSKPAPLTSSINSNSFSSSFNFFQKYLDNLSTFIRNDFFEIIFNTSIPTHMASGFPPYVEP